MSDQETGNAQDVKSTISLQESNASNVTPQRELKSFLANNNKMFSSNNSNNLLLDKVVFLNNNNNNNNQFLVELEDKWLLLVVMVWDIRLSLANIISRRMVGWNVVL